MSGGRAVIFVNQVSGQDWNDATIESVALDTKKRSVVYRGGTYPRARSGFLFIARRGKLYAVPFDETGLTTSGTPTAVLNDLMMIGAEARGATAGVAQYDLSTDGTLVARTGQAQGAADAGGRHLVLFEASGQRTFTSDDANRWRSVGPFSPDSRFPTGEGLWLGFSSARDAYVIGWSHDGTRLLVIEDRTVVAVPVDTSTGVPVFGASAALFTTTGPQGSVSPDGRRFAALEARPGDTTPEFGTQTMGGDRTHVLLGVGWLDGVARTPR